jgi:hypothetical protein
MKTVISKKRINSLSLKKVYKSNKMLTYIPMTYVFYVISNSVPIYQEGR